MPENKPPQTAIDEEMQQRKTLANQSTQPQKSLLVFSLKMPKERYTLLDTLGEGGMGTVEQVRDQLLERVVARKKIKASASELLNFSNEQIQMLRRLQREAQITAVLEHPNIVPLYDMQQESTGEFSFTMRKVGGQTLRAIFENLRQKPESYDENKLLSIYLKICDAMSYAHSRNIVHRDLKPDNIMVGQFGEVYVMDWGIAKILKLKEEEFPEGASEDEGEDEVQTIGGMGTPGYMAPEQAKEAHKVTPQADIYALGKMLRECFTWLSPKEELKQEIAQKNLEAEFRKNKLPLDILAIIERATQEKLEERYKNIQEMIQDIERYQQNLLVSARSYGHSERVLKWLKRNKQKVGIGLLVGIVALILSIMFPLYYWKKGVQEREQTCTLLIQKAKQKQDSLESVKGVKEKIKSLLDIYKWIEEALALKPKNPELEKQKRKIGEELIQSSCENENYALATYIADNLQQLSILNQEEKNSFYETIEYSRTALLREHHRRLEELKVSLLDPQKGDNERALVEIARMQEEEIVDELIQIVESGTKYFLNDQTRTPKKDEYYQFFVSVLGNTGNKKAIEPVVSSLLKMSQKYDPLLATKNETQKYESFYKDEERQYMVELTQSLGNLKASETSNILLQIRIKMGQNGLFWEPTEPIYKEMLNRNSKTNITSSLNDRGVIKCFQGNYEGAIT
ncbi:MAG: protein kinase, partial [Planctomycetota bacterium]